MPAFLRHVVEELAVRSERCGAEGMWVTRGSGADASLVNVSVSAVKRFRRANAFDPELTERLRM